MECLGNNNKKGKNTEKVDEVNEQSNVIKKNKLSDLFNEATSDDDNDSGDNNPNVNTYFHSDSDNKIFVWENQRRRQQ